MSIEHGTPFSAGDEESLRQFLDSLEAPAEPLDMAKKILQRRGLIALSTARTLYPEVNHDDQDDPDLVEAIRTTVTNQLNAYNLQHRIIRQGDHLTINGFLFARLTIPDVAVLETQLDPHHHVAGDFMKLVSMPAPPQDHLYDPYADMFITNRHNYTPGIRITDVSISDTLSLDGTTEVQTYPEGSHLDLPLYFADMDIQRIYK